MGLINRFLAPWRTAARFDEFLSNQNMLLREQLLLARAQQETVQALVNGVQQFAALYETDGPCRAGAHDEDAAAMEAYIRALQDQNLRKPD